jgi:hypothetical protein
MTAKPDTDIIALRRILAAAKSKRSHHNRQLCHWIEGVFDNTPYFQAALAEMKECRKDGLIL